MQLRKLLSTIKFEIVTLVLVTVIYMLSILPRVNGTKNDKRG